MPFDPDLAAIRFGTGLSPRIAPPESARAMMDRLLGPDEAARAFPVPPYSEVAGSLPVFAAASRASRNEEGAARERARAELAAIRTRARVDATGHLRAVLARNALAEDGFRERLALFWADHFTVAVRGSFDWHLIQPFIDEAIRPRMTGPFHEMLLAVETHPVMLRYLDQPRSVGPGSRVGQRGGRGLNENLARELLELHTLGVGGPYGQGDVRELAELLTGLGVTPEGGLAFLPRRAEPGGETVLGVTYPAEGLAAVEAALGDLGRHPATGAHLARKLAVHFVADEPPEALVADLAATFDSTGGDLGAVTAALIDHPAAWEGSRVKVKPPFGFLASAMRALDVGAEVIAAWDERATRRMVLGPLAAMGQAWMRPNGPDGWAEGAEAWVTPQFVAGRIDWAMNRPEELVEPLPDPRDLARTALGSVLSDEVAFAARAAEDVAEGVGVVLASADFQRR